MSISNYNTSLTNNNLIVNDLNEIQRDFIQMIKDDKETVSLYFKLFRQVPEIHKNYVLSVIRNQFKDKVEDYIKTIPYFFSHFSMVDKKICDE